MTSEGELRHPTESPAASPDAALLTSIASKVAVDPSAITVLTHRPGRVVCKVHSGDGIVVAKASTIANEFDTEADAMRRLASLGLPVSKVLNVVSDPPALLIAEWVDGQPVITTSPPDILAAVGELLARVHRLPSDGPFSSHPTIEAWITAWLGDLARWWSERSDAPDQVVDRINRWLSTVQPILATRQGSMILFDGRPEHFLIDRQGAIRMIDVADLMPGDPLMDLAVFEMHAPGSLPGLLAGYHLADADGPEIARLLPLYRFLRHLAGAEWQLRTSDNVASASWHLGNARSQLARHAPLD